MSLAPILFCWVISSTPVIKPSEGSLEVLRTLHRCNVPLASSSATTSVKVPPISTAIRQLMPLLLSSSQNQIAVRINPPAPVRCDQHSRVILLDDRRAAQRGPGRKIFPLVDRAVEEFTVREKKYPPYPAWSNLVGCRRKKRDRWFLAHP